GTSTTPLHVQKLMKQSDHVFFCFDGDNAGRKAAWRALENSLSQLSDGKEISFLFLPQGEDPDSFVRSRGREAFESLLKEALPLSTFLVNELKSRANLGTEEGRARFLYEAKPYLSKIEAPNLGLILRKRIAQIANIELAELEGLFQVKRVGRSEKTPPRKNPGKSLNVVRKLTEMLLYSPTLAKLVDRSSMERPTDVPGMREEEMAALYRLLDFLSENEGAGMAHVMEHFRESPEGRILQEARPAIFGLEETGLSGEELEREFLDAWKQYLDRLCKAKIDRLLAKANASGWTKDSKEEYLQLQQRLNML
ncbi:MAG TPA: toprim domain-containing protein, partial [Burkholderiales bacterium]|nr:toprim domain-containing protein [Burkholderiales bacterium]